MRGLVSALLVASLVAAVAGGVLNGRDFRHPDGQEVVEMESDRHYSHFELVPGKDVAFTCEKNEPYRGNLKVREMLESDSQVSKAVGGGIAVQPKTMFGTGSCFFPKKSVSAVCCAKEVTQPITSMQNFPGSKEALVEFAHRLVELVAEIHQKGYVVGNVCPQHISIDKVGVRFNWLGHARPINAKDGQVHFVQGNSWVDISEAQYTDPRVFLLYDNYDSDGKEKDRNAVEKVAPGVIDMFGVGAVIFEYATGTPLLGQGGVYNQESSARFASSEWFREIYHLSRRVAVYDEEWRKKLSSAGFDHKFAAIIGACLDGKSAEDVLKKFASERDPEPPQPPVETPPQPNPLPANAPDLDDRQMVKFIFPANVRSRRTEHDANLYLYFSRRAKVAEMIEGVNAARHFSGIVGGLVDNKYNVLDDTTPLSDHCDAEEHACEVHVGFYPEVRYLKYFRSKAPTSRCPGQLYEEVTKVLNPYADPRNPSPNYRAFVNMNGKRFASMTPSKCKKKMEGHVDIDDAQITNSGKECRYDHECASTPKLEFCHLEREGSNGFVGRCSPGINTGRTHHLALMDSAFWSTSGRHQKTTLSNWYYFIPSGSHLSAIAAHLNNDPTAPGPVGKSSVLLPHSRSQFGKQTLTKTTKFTVIPKYTYDLIEALGGRDLDSRCYDCLYTLAYKYSDVLKSCEHRCGDNGKDKLVAAAISDGSACTGSTDCAHYPFSTCQMKTLWSGVCVAVDKGAWQNRDIEDKPDLISEVMIDFYSGGLNPVERARELAKNEVVKKAPYEAFNVPDAARSDRHKWSYPGAPFDCEGFRIQDQGRCGTCWAYASATSISQKLCVMTQGKGNIFASPAGFFIRSKDYYISVNDSPIPAKYKGAKGIKGGDLIHPDVPYVEKHGGRSDEAYSRIAENGRETRIGVLPFFCRPLECKKEEESSQYAVFASMTKDPELRSECGNSRKVQRVNTDEFTPQMMLGQNYNFMATWTEVAQQIYAHLTNNGPLSISVDIKHRKWCHQEAGDITIPKLAYGSTNHAVTLVGWGTDKVKGKEMPYWLIQNSYGTSWGYGGYYKAYRGFDEECWTRQASSSEDLECPYDYIMAPAARGYVKVNYGNIADTTREAYIGTATCGKCDNGGYMFLDCSKCVCRGNWQGTTCNTCGLESCPTKAHRINDSCECECTDPEVFGSQCDQRIEIGLTTPTKEYPNPALELQYWNLVEVARILGRNSFPIKFTFTNLKSGDKVYCEQMLHRLDTPSPNPFYLWGGCADKISGKGFNRNTWAVTARVPTRLSELGEVLDSVVPVKMNV